MNEMPFIRKAQKGDEEDIHESHMRSIREVCIHEHGPEETKGWGYREPKKDWIGMRPNEHIWVVEYRQKIEGHGLIRIKDAKAYILGLYLTPIVLGKGFGKALLRNMLTAAKTANVSTVYLDSTLTAHTFYQHFGFVDTQTLQKRIINGYPVSCIPMKKDI